MVKISIIIPSYEDKGHVQKLTKQIKSQIGNSSDWEILVIEGSGEKYSAKLPKNVAFFNSPKYGRAEQMNFGFENAKGKFILFIHADSNISKMNLHKLLDIKEKYFWGCFHIDFDSPKRYFRFLSWNSNRRAKANGISFGDQGLFVSRELFENVGLFPVGGFEDIDIAIALDKVKKLHMFNEFIISSPRRFLEHGVMRTHFIMGFIFLSYLNGGNNFANYLYSLINRHKFYCEW